MSQYSITLRDALLAAMKSSLGSTLQMTLYNSATGTIPATADEVLTSLLSTDITKLCVLTANAGSSPGMTFGTPASGIINKTGAETWQSNATIGAFTGFQSGASALPAHFFRLCVYGNDGSAGDTGSTAIFQGTVGTVAGVFDLYLPTATITVGTQVGPVSAFQVVDGNG
jgi:hypothetical protein